MTLIMRVFLEPNTVHYLVSFEPDAMAGCGLMVFTDDPLKAQIFPDLTSLHAEWTRTSTVSPLGPTGIPNRPLCNFAIAPVPLSEVARAH